MRLRIFFKPTGPGLTPIRVYVILDCSKLFLVCPPADQVKGSREMGGAAVIDLGAPAPGRQEACGAQGRKIRVMESCVLAGKSCLPFPTGTGFQGALENGEEDGMESMTAA